MSEPVRRPRPPQDNAAVLIMARAPRRGEVLRALEPTLGPAGCAALQSALITEALRWATHVAPHGVYIAHDPPDAGAELRALTGGNGSVFPQNGDGIAGRLADAAGRVFSRSAGPLLIVWPDLPVFRAAHANAALDDLRTGCDLVLGPVIDGGLYLIGFSKPLPSLFTLPEQVWRSPDPMAIGVAAVRTAGLDIGLIRAERALHRPSDVRAALADPTVPESIRQLLRERLRTGPAAADQ